MGVKEVIYIRALKPSLNKDGRSISSPKSLEQFVQSHMRKSPSKPAVGESSVQLIYRCSTKFKFTLIHKKTCIAHLQYNLYRFDIVLIVAEISSTFQLFQVCGQELTVILREYEITSYSLVIL